MIAKENNMNTFDDKKKPMKKGEPFGGKQAQPFGKKETGKKGK